MEFEKIKQLMEAMKEHGIHNLSIKEKNGFEISLEFAHAQTPVQRQIQQEYVETTQPSQMATRADMSLKKEELIAEKVTEVNGELILSPMVGIFYAGASPEEQSFVKIGDRVDPDTVVCIIEAMKVMNEVKAGKSGIVKEIYSDNSNPVEFGSKLFLVE
ncbi:MAG: acetyl-CoA carboxylase biotin carboxyl carrier protein [Simkaniaceae bacterium]|nr:acetyl-CoA carboxylase biotin carboxyl carrier protein [Simkaniaceae bacterium]